MNPSPPMNTSLPSLSSMTSTANEKRSVTSVSSGTSSSVSSDSSNLSAASHGEEAGTNVAPSDGQWYYYLSPNAAKRLPQYQYKGADTSPLYKYVLSPFATWCVDNHTPAWLAPNAITLIGLSWMVLSYCVIWFWCPGMYEANTDVNTNWVPGAIFLLNGCAMLIYQTLDNMDGKQARKTGSSSPLGLLFDHGCDAMNSILGSANWIAAMAMVPGNVSDLLGGDDHDNIQSKAVLAEFFGGDAILAYLLMICPMVAFYVTTWEQYHTGVLILPPFNGPSEGLIIGASLSFISFLWGPMYWQGTTLADGAIARLVSFMGEEDLYFTPFQGRVRNMDLVVLAAIIGLAREVILKIIFVLRTHGLQSLRTTVPNLLLVSSTFAMVYFDPTMFLRRPRTMMHLMSGLFTEQVTQLMLDHTVEQNYLLRNRWCLFPPVFFAMTMATVSYSSNFLDMVLYVYTCGIWLYVAFKIFVQLYEICDVLGIWCFDIVTPHPKKLSEVRGEIVGSTVCAVGGTAKKMN